MSIHSEFEKILEAITDATNEFVKTHHRQQFKIEIYFSVEHYAYLNALAQRAEILDVAYEFTQKRTILGFPYNVVSLRSNGKHPDFLVYAVVK